MKNTALIIASLTALAVLAFGNLAQTFFLQDEWAIFGNYLYWQKANLSWFTRLFVYEQETHLIPLANAVSYLQFKVFGLHFSWYAYASILLHGVNAYLVYILARKLLKETRIAVISSLFFLVNAPAHQGVTWVATTIGTAGSAFFVLLSLIFLHHHVVARKAFSWNFIISLCFFVLSLGFKETSIFLFVFYPLFVILTTRKKRKKILVGTLVSLFLIGIIYVSARVGMSGFWTQTAATAQELSQPNIIVYGYRFLTNPIKIAAQSVIPQAQIVAGAQLLMRLAYPQFMTGGTPDPYLVTSVASDIVTYGIAFFLALFMLLVYPKARSVVLISVAFIITSSIPFLIIPGRAGYISLFDGRHLYMTSIFTSILMSFVYVLIYNAAVRNTFLRIATVIGLVLYIGWSARTIRRDNATQVAIANTRQSILATITRSYPTVPSRVVFYIESDKAYYGLPPEETIVPFQSGFGQTLLVWYNARGGDFPACFFERKFLYVLMSQDYKECEGRGFGYYRNFERLGSVVKAYKIESEHIIAFRFNSSANALIDISAEIRQKLKLQ